MPYQPIGNYGVIGDTNTVALVGMNGSIDFMCFPRFDSPTIFAALLDDEKGGRFQIAPTIGDIKHDQLYLPDTNVLLTRFLSRDGVLEISDFMPVEELGPANILVRRVKTVRGCIPVRMCCDPRFDYASVGHSVEVHDEGHEIIFAAHGHHGTVLRLRSSLPLQVHEGTAMVEFTLDHGENATFVLELVKEGAASPVDAGSYVSDAFKETVNFWRYWIGKSTYKGRWRGMVNRSALVLKLLTSWEHGSIVAAPTFGLPETIGGERNWDYRYTWIRDSAFTLYAFMRLGMTQEAEHFMEWIEARSQEIDLGEPLQPVYGLAGDHRLHEIALDHLEGYKGSRPVRIGNDAYRQFQLDIYGELMDTVYLYDKFGRPLSHDLWNTLSEIVDWVCENWQQPDDGIWEIRAAREYEFVHSRLMCWVALDRAIRLGRKRSLPAPLDRWRTTRDEIYRDIYANFWDPDQGAFVQHKNTDALDAATLLMPLMRFISPTDPRWLSTMKAIKRKLVEDALVYRYRQNEGAPDGLTGEEGSFFLCSFWYIEALSRSGDIDQARLLFEKMLGYSNHLGLYAEQIGPRGEHLGNFPQALTHLALISAAYDLDRRLSEAGWEA